MSQCAVDLAFDLAIAEPDLEKLSMLKGVES